MYVIIFPYLLLTAQFQRDLLVVAVWIRSDVLLPCRTFCLFITVERSGEIGKTCTSIQSWADTLKAHHIVKT